jgi:hypothetical protein
MLSYRKSPRAQSRNLAPTSKGNGLDLDRHALGQLLDSHAGAGRLVSEVLLVDRVHLGEVVHGGDEDVDLQECIVSKMSKAFWVMAMPLPLDLYSGGDDIP